MSTEPWQIMWATLSKIIARDRMLSDREPTTKKNKYDSIWNINSVYLTNAGTLCFIVLRDHLKDAVLADPIQDDSIFTHMQTDLSFLELIHVGNIVVMLPLYYNYFFVHDFHLNESFALGKKKQICIVDGNHAAVVEKCAMGDLNRMKRCYGCLFVVEKLYYFLGRDWSSC